MRGGRRAASYALLLTLLAPAPALAVGRTGAEVRALAARAGQDGGALAALKATDAVDGVPADLGAALDGARGRALEARLAALARPAAVGPNAPAAGPNPPAAASARADATEILAEGRFAQTTRTHPARSLTDRLGDWLGDVFGWLDTAVPGPPGIALAALGLAVLLLAAWLTSRVSGRLQLVADTRLVGVRGRASDPVALERDASAAEASGDYANAVRLRFAAGLVRLDLADAIRLRPSLTTGQVGRTLGSPRFDDLAATFDAVAYGGRPARPEDAAAAREAWPRVLQEAGS